jgi:NhaC family Na+:H+ antiporter
VDLFEHIRHMLFTTVPSMVIALILYALLGLSYSGGELSAAELAAYVAGLEGVVTMSAWLLLPPVLVLGLVIRRVPALPALVVGVRAGGLAAMVLQGESLAGVMVIAYEGFVAETGNAAVDDLLSRGGMSSMYGTVILIVCALCFGGIMERAGMLERLGEAILSLAHSRGGLISATLGTSFGINMVAADQYLSIVVPGRMYRPAYQRQGLHLKNLSRCMEDGGTITSPLIPWNSCGAYMFATLGVFPLAYLPFAFLNLINPLISAVYGFTGWTVAPTPSEFGEQEHETD